MYNHRVHYTYDKPQGMISETQTLEFELEKDLEKDGPGQWRNICANIIQSKTGISAHLVRTKNDSSFRCISLGKVVTGNETKNVSYSEFKREQKINERQERDEEERRERREAVYRQQEENERELEEEAAQRRFEREAARVEALREMRENAKFEREFKQDKQDLGDLYERLRENDPDYDNDIHELNETSSNTDNETRTLSQEFEKMKNDFNKSIQEVKKAFNDSIENLKSEFQTTKDKFKKFFK